MSTPPAEFAAFIRDALLDWYDRKGRSLPWRKNADPYRILVSEFMLQQTRVETVVPYFERWMRRFPSLLDLADADLDSVLALWSGLGYYSRARRLHATARLVRDRHDGAIPDTITALRELPGVGPYTAGAIASIAYDRAEPAVDGNVRRVLARLFDIEDDSPARLDAIARGLVAAKRPGAFNQALMELGGRVCAPRSPDCEACPVEAVCAARQRGTVSKRPRKRSKSRVPTFAVGTAVILSAAGRIALGRRRPDGLLGGLWEFPGLVAESSEPPSCAAKRTAASIIAAHDLDHAEPEPLTPMPHAFTHRRHVYHPHVFRIPGEPRLSSSDETWTQVAWHDSDALDRRPLPAAQRNLSKQLRTRLRC